MRVKFGTRQFERNGRELCELRDANALLGNWAGVKQRMDEDGYLWFRGLIDPAAVATARRTILEHLSGQNVLVPNTPILEGVMARGSQAMNMMGRAGIAHHADVMAVVESAALYDFFSGYFGEPATTFPYKWLRAVGNEKFTGAHYDVVYMGRGSPRLHTAWIPMGDVPVDQGALAVCVGSHHLDGFRPLRESYGRTDVDRDGTDGWFTSDPTEVTQKFGGRWCTADFRAGDVMIFGMYTLHASTTNTTDRYRLSCDVRFQPASDPMDPRWTKTGQGHTYDSTRKMVDSSARQDSGSNPD